MRTIVWFRGADLRITDHAPLREAVDLGEVIPLFILDPESVSPDRARERPHHTQFLLDSLRALEASLVARGSRLLVVAGPSVEVITGMARRWNADRVVAHRMVDPAERELERRVREALGGLELYEGQTLLPMGTLRTGAGDPYSVFTPFARAFERDAVIADPLPKPRSLPPVPRDVTATTAEIPTSKALRIERNPEVLEGGEGAGIERLRRFLRGPAATYATGRDRLDVDGTSRLSADLVFGTVSVRQVWNAVTRALDDSESARSFRNELIWREFAHSTLWDRPHVLERPFRPEFAGFPWRYDAALWRAWVAGETGYPVVDAAARQLLGEGFVHNRARMISASFLTKDLLIDYRRGEAHYIAYLTDGDPAQNNLGWQWSAGCGVDAQPYFRVFNPVSQGKRFDPEGDYVRRWVPELARMPPRHIHQPWKAPGEVLRDAGVRLGRDYPHPVVDHQAARKRFLAVATKHLKRNRGQATGLRR